MITYDLAVKTRDHAALAAIAKQSPFTKDFCNEVMFSTDHAYASGWVRAAFNGAKLVGFSCVRHHVRAPTTKLYFIAVDKTIRGAGIGTKLMWALIEECRQLRRTIKLDVYFENPRARDLYLLLGFVDTGKTVKGWLMERGFE